MTKSSYFDNVSTAYMGECNRRVSGNPLLKMSNVRKLLRLQRCQLMALRGHHRLDPEEPTSYEPVICCAPEEIEKFINSL